MKKFLNYIILFIFVMSVFLVSNPNTTYALTVDDIVATPSTVNSPASYQIDIKLGVSTGADQDIYIKFPSGYTLPSDIIVSNVEITIGIEPYRRSYHPSNIRVLSNTITLTLSHSILKFEPATITFDIGAGIINPSYPSTYDIEIWTENELTHQSYTVSIGAGGGGSTVVAVTAYPTPVDSNEVAKYTVIFHTSQNGALISSNGDYVDIYFPIGTVLPANPDPSKVWIINFPCVAVEISGQRVRVYVPPALNFIAAGGQCDITFLKEFGIVNPDRPGNYAVQVATSKDTGLAASYLYKIMGTSITDLSVIAAPTSQNIIAKYQVGFTVSASGTLASGTDKINIIFPEEVVLPSSIIPGAVTVNGTPCISVVIESGNKLVITTPVSVSANGAVSIVISADFGIKNPTDTGVYDITVYTSSDTTRVSDIFTVTSSQIIQPTVQLSTTSAGQVSAYTISFTTGASGALVGGVDKINVIFPVGTTVPSVISLSAVMVNNIPTTNVAVYGTTVEITVPVSIPANSNITVTLSESALIKNPVSEGSYFLYVNTTKETSSVASSLYTIYIVPETTIAVTPSLPDGLNGYYKIQPTVVFTATSAIDVNPSIYYYFDNNNPVLYGGNPITVPEGIHTLFYYAVDSEGHQEGIKSVQFRVDTVPPQLAVTSPVDNAVLNSNNIAVSGVVDVGAIVKVDGQPVSVDAAGHFNTIITISGNSAVIAVAATDLAGNSVQEMLHVSLDTTPPPLTVTSPIPFQEIHKLPVLVQGTTDPGATVTDFCMNFTNLAKTKYRLLK